MFLQIQFMGKPVPEDNPETGVKENFQIGFDRRIPLPYYLYLFSNI